MGEGSASSDSTTIGRQKTFVEEKNQAHALKTTLSADRAGFNPHDEPPNSPRLSVPHDMFQRRTSLDLDDYFVGPRDMSRHSKWPMFLRMHGSIMPKMIVPLVLVGAWASLITVVSMKVHHLGVDSVLLTITGFTISLGLSFRSSTAYERYAEGRRYWALLSTSSQALGRVFWIHATDVPGQDTRELMLRKITAMNLIVAYAHSIKHALRFEPYSGYADMSHLVSHLNFIADEATKAHPEKVAPPPRKNFFKETGEYLGVTFATSNPRKAIKKTDLPLGNVPLEILNYIAVTVDEMIRNDQLAIPMLQTLAYNNLSFLNDVLTGCQRVLNTPLPLAYSIAITQITWVYVMLLPFQLIPLLDWIAIPASVVAAYIILGLLLIGEEIENPFGHDVNDLPLDKYCEEIAQDMDTIASHDKRDPLAFMDHEKNKPLYPASTASLSVWMHRDEEKLRQAIKSKHAKVFELHKTEMAKNGEDMV
ncbi:ion channel-forming bestrophin family protein [Geosmithia morbida]|uniref:Ion channel-forming bestrophin family protein n=1 Tax=Geosmithia morbida TaxID=1094350 RepID=A0A9P5D2B0_9HYPO|nr:ion channel-forming bestrophin family protein [Geosmithia morbida]KAF4119329.1 ion channel-forming bestrophin family protein [Geosmithia morbida]